MHALHTELGQQSTPLGLSGQCPWDSDTASVGACRVYLRRACMHCTFGSCPWQAANTSAEDEIIDKAEYLEMHRRVVLTNPRPTPNPYPNPNLEMHRRTTWSLKPNPNPTPPRPSPAPIPTLTQALILTLALTQALIPTLILALAQPYRRVVLSLQPTVLPHEAVEAAEEDWERDAEGKSGLDRARFYVCWFELADLWTDDIDRDEYVDFLEAQREIITERLPDGRVPSPCPQPSPSRSPSPSP